MSLFSKQIPKNKNERNKSLPGSVSFNFPKRFASHFLYEETPRCTCFTGTFTLEAAVVLPLMVSFFVTILFFFRIMEVQIEVQKALFDTGRKLAVYLSVEEGSHEFAEDAVAKALFCKELEDREKVRRYVKGGSKGISLAESDLSGDEICLNAVYTIPLPVRMFWEWDIKMVQRAECRKWTGWHPSGDTGDGDTWVYVTETGTVYHRTKSCSYLTLSIQSVPYDKIHLYRNENGGKYRECILCADKNNDFGRVYITNQGDCYHKDLNCSGIKRTVYIIRISEIGNRRACSKCGYQ